MDKSDRDAKISLACVDISQEFLAYVELVSPFLVWMQGLNFVIFCNERPEEYYADH